MHLTAPAEQQFPDAETIRGLIPGITEGGLIVIGMIVLLILILFYFGNTIKKAIDVNIAESRATKAEVAATKKVAAEGTYQVQNNHESNLRDDLDAKHEAHSEKLDKILEMVGARFDRMNDRITGLDDRITGIDVRLNRRQPATATIARDQGETHDRS